MTDPRWGETGPPAPYGSDSDATAQFGHFRDPDSFQGEYPDDPDKDGSYRAPSYDRGNRRDDPGHLERSQGSRGRGADRRDQPHYPDDPQDSRHRSAARADPPYREAESRDQRDGRDNERDSRFRTTAPRGQPYRETPQDTRSRGAGPPDQAYQRDSPRDTPYRSADAWDQPSVSDHRRDESYDRYYGDPEAAARGDEPRPYDLRQDGRGSRIPAERQRDQTRGLPGVIGVGIVVGAALLGAVGTVLTGSAGPGLILGACLLAGTAAAGLAVRSRAAYLLIPVPALAYLGTALITGLIQDPTARASRTALVVAAAQWTAAGFKAMTGATVLAIVITLGRWALGRRMKGQRPRTPQRTLSTPRRRAP